MFDFWFTKVIVFTDGAQKQADTNCDHNEARAKNITDFKLKIQNAPC